MTRTRASAAPIDDPEMPGPSSTERGGRRGGELPRQRPHRGVDVWRVRERLLELPRQDEQRAQDGGRSNIPIRRRSGGTPGELGDENLRGRFELDVAVNEHRFAACNCRTASLGCRARPLGASASATSRRPLLEAPREHAGPPALEAPAA